MDKLLRPILTMVLTSMFSLLIITAIKPKGLKFQQIPQFIELLKHRHHNMDAQNLLKLMENEEQMALLLSELNGNGGATLNPQNSIATQTTADSVVIDPNELEALGKMNISAELKAEIRQNYQAVGGLPSAAIQRAPASETAPIKVEPKKAHEARQLSYKQALQKLHATLATRTQKPTN